MKPPPSLKTAMTPFPYAVERTAPRAEARHMMDAHEVRHLPVVDGHELYIAPATEPMAYGQPHHGRGLAATGRSEQCHRPAFPDLAQ